MAKIAEILNNVVSDSGVEISSLQPLLTNPVTGTGTTNYIPKFTGTSAIGNSSMYDNSGNIGINTISAAAKLHIYGAFPELRLEGNNDVSGSGFISFYRPTSGIDGYIQSGGSGLSIDATTNLLFRTGGSERMRLDASGNLGLGTSSPSYKLDVNGTGRFIGPLTNPGIYISGNMNGTRPTTNEGLAIGQNFQAGTVDVGFWNTYLPSTFANTKFSWYQLTSASTSTELMTLTNSGNLGLGVTPSAWSVTGKVFEFGGGGGSASLFDNGINDTWYSSNAYYNGTNWIYKSTGTATQYYQGNVGQHKWYIAPSGTAGNAISFTQAMTLDASGRLGIGTTSPANKLQVVYTSTDPSLSSDAGSGLSLAGNVGVRLNMGALANSPYNAWIQASNGSGTAYAIALNPLGGNVGIGTSSPTAKLDVLYFGGTSGGQVAIRDGAGDNSTSVLNLRFGQGYAGTVGSVISSGKEGVWGGATSTWHSNLIFSTTSSGTEYERMRITSGGNVLIGTTSTYYANNLIVAAGSEGGITIANSNTTGAQYLMFADGTSGADRYRGYLAYDHTANNLFLGTDGVERMRITSGGNVLVGTTTDAGYKLDVNGVANFTSSPAAYGTIIRVRDTVTAGTESFSGVHFTSSPGTDYTIGKWTTAAGAGLLQIRDQAGSQFVTINGSGNVGVGTTSPSTRLHVSESSSGGAYLTLENLRTATFDGDYNGQILFRGNDPDGSGTRASIGALVRGVSGQTDLVFSTASTGASLAERMRITSGGQVGIGTTTVGTNGILALLGGGLTIGGVGACDAAIHIRQSYGGFDRLLQISPQYGVANKPGLNLLASTNNTGDHLWWSWGVDINNSWKIQPGSTGFSGSTGFFITNGGNVGIGTSNPTEKLVIENAGQVIASLINTSTSLDAAIRVKNISVDSYIGSNASGAYIYTATNHPILFYTNTSEKVRITSGGAVGIGTTNPSQLFQVAGNEMYGTKINAVGTTYGSGAFLNAFTSAGANDVGFAGFIASQNNNTTNRLWMGVHSPSGANQAFIGTPDSTPLAFWTNSSERMRITSGGLVGIGTSSPGALLNLNGISNGTSIRTDHTTSYTILYSYINGASPIALDNTSGNLDIYTGGSTRMRITSGGNVLVGTTSDAGYKLDVAGSLRSTLGGLFSGPVTINGSSIPSDRWFEITGTTTGKVFGAVYNPTFTYTGANIYGIYVGNNFGTGTITNSYNLFIEATNTGSATVSNKYGLYQSGSGDKNYFAGLVGIGTFSPQRTLDVIGSSNDVPAASFGRGLSIGNWSGIGFGYVEAGNSNYRKAALVFERTGGAAEGKIHILNNNSADISSASLADARLTILPGGNVGIGTTSPITSLHIKGADLNSSIFIEKSGSNILTIGTESAWLGTGTSNNAVLAAYGSNSLLFGTNAFERMRITSDGTLMVGTTSQTYNNATYGYVGTFKSPVSQAYLSIATSGQTPTSQGMLIGLDATAGQIYVLDNKNLNFYTNSAERMRITSGGNLLVGTTTDSGQKFQVSGSATVANLISSGTYSYLKATNSGGSASIGSINNELQLMVGSANVEVARLSSNAITGGVLQVTGSIKTATPGSPTTIGPAWKLGDLTDSSSLSLDTTQYVLVEINGVQVPLAIVNLP